MANLEDEFDDLAAELRQAVGREFRLEAEELELDAQKAALRQRELSDVAFELMSRGDTVIVTVADRSFKGVLVHAAGTLATVQTDHAVVDLDLTAPLSMRVAQRARAGGRGASAGSRSFRARLSEFELSAEHVELIAPGVVDSLVCTIEVVGKDHVVAVDKSGEQWFLPLRTVTAAVRSQ